MSASNRWVGRGNMMLLNFPEGAGVLRAAVLAVADSGRKARDHAPDLFVRLADGGKADLSRVFKSPFPVEAVGGFNTALATFWAAVLRLRSVRTTEGDWVCRGGNALTELTRSI